MRNFRQKEMQKFIQQREARRTEKLKALKDEYERIRDKIYEDFYPKKLQSFRQKTTRMISVLRLA